MRLTNSQNMGSWAPFAWVFPSGSPFYLRLFREEIFGPVLSAITFKNEAEALEIANDIDLLTRSE